MSKENLQKRINNFINKARVVHDDEDFDYSRVYETYKGSQMPVCIIDKSINPETGSEYGEFWITPNNFLKGSANRIKRGFRISKSKRFNQDTFIERCKKVHKEENLDYSQVVYKGAHEKIYIIDNDINPNTGEIYGGYWQEANSHLRGCKHPLKKRISVPCKKVYDIPLSTTPVINEIYYFIRDLLKNDNVVKQTCNIVDDELAIYVPSKKVAIDYYCLDINIDEDKNYHLQKLKDCQEKGVTLLQIFEDEYKGRKDLVLSKLRHMLGGDSGLPKVMARKCVINEIDKNEARLFLDTYHIQGFTSSTVYLGCFYNNTLIGVMCFKNEGNEWNLTRFASDYHYVCQGVGGKLFKYFIKHYSPNVVKTFLDRRWAFNINSNLYTKLGFEMDKIEAPDYAYTKGHGERLHKFGFRKQILHRKYGLPLSMTEKEMANKLGYSRIWNCGLIRYIWKKKCALYT